MSNSIMLKPGYYIAGYDIAAGIVNFHVQAVKSGGVIHSSNAKSGGICEILSEGDPKYAARHFYGISLPRGTQLLIEDTEVVVDWDSDFTPIERTYDYSNTRILTEGKYRVGTAIEPGYYDMELLSGWAHVGTNPKNNRFNQLNTALQFGDDLNIPVPKFKNVLLESGDSLEITDISMQTYLKYGQEFGQTKPESTKLLFTKCTSKVESDEDIARQRLSNTTTPTYKYNQVSKTTATGCSTLLLFGLSVLVLIILLMLFL